MWRVQYTNAAELDLESIYEYIFFELHEPETAKKQLIRIMDAISSLYDMPYRYRLYEKEPWFSKGLRVLTLDNYLIYYLPCEPTKTVDIIRVLYGGRNILAELSP